MEDPTKVLDWIKQEGEFDKLRNKIAELSSVHVGAAVQVLEQLRQSDALKEKARKLMAESPVLKDYQDKPPEPAIKQQVFIKLRKDIEKDLQEHAAQVAWSIITDQQGDIYKQIQETVHLGLCKTYEDLHPDAGAAGPSDHPQAATAAAAAAGTAAAAGPSDPGGGGAVKRERSASGDGAARDVKRPAAVAPGQHTSR